MNSDIMCWLASLNQMDDQKRKLRTNIQKLETSKRVLAQGVIERLLKMDQTETVYGMCQVAYFGLYVDKQVRNIRPGDVDMFIAQLNELPPKQGFAPFNDKICPPKTTFKISTRALENTVLVLQCEVSSQLPLVIGEIVLSYVYQFQDNVIPALKAIDQQLDEQYENLKELRTCERRIKRKIILQLEGVKIVRSNDCEISVCTKKQRQDITVQDVDNFINRMTELPPKESFVEFWTKNHTIEIYSVLRRCLKPGT